MTGPLFLSIISTSKYSPMEKDKLKLIVRNLKLLVDALESEVYSDTAAYLDKRENLDDPASYYACLLYTSPSPRDMRRSRMPSSA